MRLLTNPRGAEIMRRMTTLDTARQVIDAFGGLKEFAAWWQPGMSVKTVWSWGERGFPPDLYVAMSRRLRAEKRIDCPPAAWGMREVERAS